MLVAAREACDAVGAALVFDEVQCGMGRTGTLWAYEQLPVKPDVLTAAKALGGGLPVGAVVTTPELAEVLTRGDHGSTFAGAPITAAAALATLDVIDDPELLARVGELGERLRDGLERIDARRRGARPRPDGRADAARRHRCRRRRCAGARRGPGINVPGERMLRLLPPLVIDVDDVDRALDLLSAAIGRVLTRVSEPWLGRLLAVFAHRNRGDCRTGGDP